MDEKKSQLMRLPAELRNHIFDIIAEHTDNIIIQEGKILLPALAQVCHQIRAEFSSIFQDRLIQADAA